MEHLAKDLTKQTPITLPDRVLFAYSGEVIREKEYPKRNAIVKIVCLFENYLFNVMIKMYGQHLI